MRANYEEEELGKVIMKNTDHVKSNQYSKMEDVNEPSEESNSLKTPPHSYNVINRHSLKRDSDNEDVDEPGEEGIILQPTSYSSNGMTKSNLKRDSEYEDVDEPGEEVNTTSYASSGMTHKINYEEDVDEPGEDVIILQPTSYSSRGVTKNKSKRDSEYEEADEPGEEINTPQPSYSYGRMTQSYSKRNSEYEVVDEPGEDINILPLGPTSFHHVTNIEIDRYPVDEEVDEPGEEHERKIYNLIPSIIVDQSVKQDPYEEEMDEPGEEIGSFIISPSPKTEEELFDIEEEPGEENEAKLTVPTILSTPRTRPRAIRPPEFGANNKSGYSGYTKSSLPGVVGVSNSTKISSLESEALAKARTRTGVSQTLSPGVVRVSARPTTIKSLDDDANRRARGRFGESDSDRQLIERAKAQKGVSREVQPLLLIQEITPAPEEKEEESNRLTLNSLQSGTTTLETDNALATTITACRSSGQHNIPTSSLPATAINSITYPQRNTGLPPIPQRNTGLPPIPQRNTGLPRLSLSYPLGGSAERNPLQQNMAITAEVIVAPVVAVNTDYSHVSADVDGEDTGYQEGLALMATTVDDVVEATIIVEEDPKLARNKKIRIISLCFCVTIFLVAGITVPLSLYAFEPPPPTLSPTGGPSATPSSAPTSIDFFSYMTELERVSNVTNFYDKKSAQYKALVWLYADNSTDIDSRNFVQRYILAVFYYSTGGDKWMHCYIGDNVCKDGKASYLSEGDECLWYGNGCKNGDWKINKLFFVTSKESLVGTLPEEISHLTMLEQINIIDNFLTGTLPKTIGSLTHLNTLYLYNNLIQSPLPDSLYNLTNLKILQLWANELKGPISPKFGEMVSLETLNLGINHFNGTIPSELGKLPKLKYLRLIRNDIHGSLPEEIFNITSLKELSIHTNKLTGTIPSIIGHLPNFKELNVTRNNMTGTIPDDFFTISSLELLDLGENRFFGTLSTKFGYLEKLEQLILPINGFSGQLPDELGLKNLTKLKKLVLDGNNFIGSMPDSICGNTNLIVLTSNCVSEKSEFKCECCTTCSQVHT